MYVYITTNLMNGKVYIGQSTKSDNISYLGSGVILEKAIKRHGRENFSKEILGHYKSIEMLDFMERFWIKVFNSTDKNIGYNVLNGGQGKDSEWKKNIGKAMKGKTRSKEQRKRMSDAHKSQIPWNKGIQISESLKSKISQSQIGHIWINNGIKNTHVKKDDIQKYLDEGWQFGRLKFSDDHKEKISKCKKNKVAWNKGISPSDESRRKMSESKRGKAPWNKGLKKVVE